MTQKYLTQQFITSDDAMRKIYEDYYTQFFGRKINSKMIMSDFTSLLDQFYNKFKTHHRSRSSYEIFVIADLHTGSKFGLYSDNAVNSFAEQHINPNQISEKFFWLYVSTRDAIGKPDVIVCNGDMVEGENKKGKGEDTWSNIIMDQKTEAVNLIKMLRGNKIRVMRGSNYHVTIDGISVEELIAKECGAPAMTDIHGKRTRINRKNLHGEIYKKNTRKKNSDKNKHGDYDNTATRTYCQPEMLMNVHNTPIHFMHHIQGSTSLMYLTTPLGKELATMALDKGKLFDPQYFPELTVRSHIHKSLKIEFVNSAGLITPAFKYPDKFLRYRGLGGTLPTVGSVSIIVEPNGRIEINKYVLPERMMPKMKPEEIISILRSDKDRFLYRE